MLTRRTFLGTAAIAPFAAPFRSTFPLVQRAATPAVPRRVFAAGPPAAVLVYTLAPGALVGWPSRLDDAALAMLPAAVRALPVVGRLAGRGSTVSLEALVATTPDLVIDVGTVDATYQSQAQRIREQTGLRYELLPGRLRDSAQVLRQAGALLGVQARAERLASMADRIVRDAEAGATRRAATRVYLARGADGLETGLRGSINTEVLEFVGAANVAAAAGTGGISRVSLEQVVAWNPEVIVTQDAAFAQRVVNDPTWATVRAVRDRRVLQAPVTPFGWIDGPPGINRLVGVQWLAARLDRRAPDAALRDAVREFHDAFYGIALTPADAMRLAGGSA